VASNDLLDVFTRYGMHGQAFSTVAQAIDAAQAIAGEHDLIIGTGSLFVVGESREAILAIPAEQYPES
jgi:hypothetical protein